MSRRLLSTVAASAIMMGGAPAGPFEYQGSFTSTTNNTVHTFTDVAIGAADADRVVIVGINWANNVDLTDVTFEGVTAFLNSTHLAPVGETALSAIAALDVPSGTTADIVCTFGTTANTCVIHVWTITLADLGFIEFSFFWEDAVTSLTLPVDVRTDGWAVGCTGAVTADMTTTWSGSDSVDVVNDALVEALYAEAVEIIATEDVLSGILTGTSGSSSDKSLAMTSFAALDPDELLHVLGQYFSEGNLTTYSFTAALGVPHADRDLVFAFAWHSSAARTVSGVTINGVSATSIQQSSSTAGGCAIFRAAVPSDLFGDIVVTMSGQCTKFAGKLVQMNPASVTPVDSDNTAGTGTALTLSNLSVSNGGFAIFATRSGLTELPAPTWNGTDSGAIETLFSRLDEANSYLGVYMIRTTETDATRDFTITTTSSGTKNIVGASWL